MQFYKVENQNQISGFSEIISNYFGNITNGFVVDVGAHDGYKWSNSYPLISAGWGGLLIEPHPMYLPNLKKIHEGRDGVVIVEKAASNFIGEAQLHHAFSLSTLKPELLDAYEKTDWAKGLNQKTSFTVKVDKLDNILNENNAKPGFEVFTLDCEGSEEEVLECFDLKYWKPKMAIVETLEVRPDWERSILDMKDGNFYKFCDDLFIGNGYKKVYVDHVNTIYVL